MDELDIEQREITKTQFFVRCPECDKEIVGNSKSQIKWNVDVHMKNIHEEQ